MRPFIDTSLLLKSAPMVGLKLSVKRACSNIWIKEVFPTPESPMATTFTKHFFSGMAVGGSEEADLVWPFV